MSKIRLSIIGCGNVARTLAYLWHKASLVDVVDVVNRSEKSAAKRLNLLVLVSHMVPSTTFNRQMCF